MIQEQLKIGVIQTSLVWENPAENRKHFEEKILACDKDTDIIVLPEMFTTGFTMNAQSFAETTDGTTIHWMQDLAKLKNAVICGSIIVEKENKYYNTFLWVFPDRTIQSYSKKHLFRLSHEQLTYTAGEESFIIHYKGWNIRPIICYDLRFPVWCRNRIHHSEAYRGEYDVLFVVASWPARRELAWRTLTQARAIENMSYLVACNRIGEDIHQINHSGYSVIHDMLGEVLTTAQSDDSTIYATLDLNTLIKTRRAYQFWRDADDFSFKPY